MKPQPQRKPHVVPRGISKWFKGRVTRMRRGSWLRTRYVGVGGVEERLAIVLLCVHSWYFQLFVLLGLLEL